MMLGSRQYGADRLYRILLIAEKPPLKACGPLDLVHRAADGLKPGLNFSGTTIRFTVENPRQD